MRSPPLAPVTPSSPTPRLMWQSRRTRSGAGVGHRYPCEWCVDCLGQEFCQKTTQISLINFVKFHPNCDTISCKTFAGRAFEALIKSPKFRDIKFEIGSGLARAYGARTRCLDWCTWWVRGGELVAHSSYCECLMVGYLAPCWGLDARVCVPSRAVSRILYARSVKLILHLY